MDFLRCVKSFLTKPFNSKTVNAPENSIVQTNSSETTSIDRNRIAEEVYKRRAQPIVISNKDDGYPPVPANTPITTPSFNSDKFLSLRTRSA